MGQPERAARTRSIAAALDVAPSRSTTGSRTCEVEHGRRRAGQRPHVELGGDGRSDPVRHVGQGDRIRAARLVRARREHRADGGEHLPPGGRQVGHPNADRVASASGQPGVAGGRVRQHEGVRPGKQLAHDRLGRAAELRDALEQCLDVGGEQRARLGRRSPLEPVEALRRVLAIRACREPVDGVGRQQHRQSRPDRADHGVDCVVPHHASTTRSFPARSFEIRVREYPCSSSACETACARASCTSRTSHPSSTSWASPASRSV